MGHMVPDVPSRLETERLKLRPYEPGAFRSHDDGRHGRDMQRPDAAASTDHLGTYLFPCLGVFGKHLWCVVRSIRVESRFVSPSRIFRICRAAMG